MEEQQETKEVVDQSPIQSQRMNQNNSPDPDDYSEDKFDESGGVKQQ